MSDPRLERPEWRGRTNIDALTIACIEHAEAIAGHQFTITQGSYQNGGGEVNSAGTHDRGGVVDIRWCRHKKCVRALREAGMFAWHRTPEQGPWVDHIHAGVIGHPLLASGAKAQELSYLRGRNGLKGDGPDDGPRLNPIPQPVWPYPPEDDMAQYDSLLKGMDQKLDRLIDAQAKSREREKKTNLLLRKLRAQVTDLATQVEIDNLLAEEE
jgi:hypothetical protein